MRKITIVILAVFLVAGCVMIPVPTASFFRPCSHGQAADAFQENRLAFMQVGQTSKEEVRRQLGAPDAIHDYGGIFLYDLWDVTVAYVHTFLVAGNKYYAHAEYLGEFPLDKICALRVEFDKQERLQRYTIRGMAWADFVEGQDDQQTFSGDDNEL